MHYRNAAGVPYRHTGRRPRFSQGPRRDTVPYCHTVAFRHTVCTRPQTAYSHCAHRRKPLSKADVTLSGYLPHRGVMPHAQLASRVAGRMRCSGTAGTTSSTWSAVASSWSVSTPGVVRPRRISETCLCEAFPARRESSTGPMPCASMACLICCTTSMVEAAMREPCRRVVAWHG